MRLHWVAFFAVLLIIHLIIVWYGGKIITLSPATMRSISVNAVFANYKFTYEIITDFRRERCAGKKLYVFIMTTGPSVSERAIIRKTWADKKHTSKSVVLFIVGDNKNQSTSELLEFEREQYNDIIQTTIPDVYNFTAFKIHAGYYLHAKFCSNVPYIIRADDDVTVLPDRAVHFIESGFFDNESKAIYGIILTGGRPVRDPNHKWYIPKDYYVPDTFPQYINGPAYFMTARSIRAILEKTNETTFFWIEDVMFTGIMTDKTGVKLIDSNGIFKFHCAEGEKAGRNESEDLCLRENSACDKEGVPYPIIIYHSPAAKRTSVEEGYTDLTKVTCG